MLYLCSRKRNNNTKTTTIMTQNWFVKKEEYVWQFVPELNMYCWSKILNEIVTPIRETQEEADKDFVELGFALKPNVIVQCHDVIENEKHWTRHIVQRKTIK
jgi:hypothetical protein